LILLALPLLPACTGGSADAFDIDAGVTEDSAGLDALLGCPDEIATPADAIGYRDLADGLAVTELFDAIVAIAREEVVPACLVDCTTPPLTECLETRCTADDSERTWSDLRLTRQRSVDLDGDRTTEHVVYSASWRGVLRADWPADFAIEAATVEWSADGSWGSTADWTHDRCQVAVGEGDALLEQLGAESRIAINGTRIEARRAQPDSDRLEGWVDGECIGEIDPDSWELIRPCSAARATGKRSEPVRRCSASYCVTLDALPPRRALACAGERR
jgi:hypothetical protein